MGLDQGGQAQLVAQPQVLSDGRRVQQSADEQHTVGTHETGLVDLILADGEILADHGQRDGLTNFREDLVRA